MKHWKLLFILSLSHSLTHSLLLSQCHTLAPTLANSVKNSPSALCIEFIISFWHLWLSFSLFFFLYFDFDFHPSCTQQKNKHQVLCKFILSLSPLSFDTQAMHTHTHTHTHTHALSLTHMLARIHTHSFQVKLINVFYVREVEKKLPIKQELSLHRQTSRHEFQKN